MARGHARKQQNSDKSNDISAQLLRATKNNAGIIQSKPEQSRLPHEIEKREQIAQHPSPISQKMTQRDKKILPNGCWRMPYDATACHTHPQESTENRQSQHINCHAIPILRRAFAPTQPGDGGNGQQRDKQRSGLTAHHAECIETNAL
ncbi:hypothetical protein AA11825_2588 [Acetobacter pomorum DSM 11825]|nr:hypothetical protein AA11825_2588 [Acetobacter pomorum DSM 11825]